MLANLKRLKKLILLKFRMILAFNDWTILLLTTSRNNLLQKNLQQSCMCKGSMSHSC